MGKRSNEKTGWAPPPWRRETRSWLLVEARGGVVEEKAGWGAPRTPPYFLTIGRKIKRTEFNPLLCNLWSVVLNTLKPINKKEVKCRATCANYKVR